VKLQSRRIWLLLAVTAVMPWFQNCGRFHSAHKQQLSNSSSDTSRLGPRVSREALPEFVSSSLNITGRCDIRAPLTISMGEGADQTLPCVNFEFNVDLTLPGADGPKTIVLTQVVRDRTLQDSIFVTKDTVPPALTLSQLSRQGNGVLIVGSCETASSSSLSVEGDVISITSPCTNNLFSIQVSLTPGDGTKQIDVVQRDRAGNVGRLRQSFVLDTRPPRVTISSPAPGANIMDSFQLSGSCESGLDVILSGAGVLSQVAARCVNGAYTLTANPSAGLGNKIMVVYQVDSSLNRGEATITLNRVAPSEPVPQIAITQPQANSVAQGQITLMGTCQTGVPVVFSGAIQPTANAICATGTFSSVVIFSNGDGNKTVTVSQTNSQNSSGTSSRNFVKDSTPPSLTFTSPQANAFVLSTGVVSGTCESLLSVAISGGGLITPISASCQNGVFSANVTYSSGDGSKAISISQTDAAGNTASINRTVQRDTVAPLVRFTAPAANSSAESGLTISGTCETGIAVVASGTGLASMTQSACNNQAFSMAVVFSAVDGSKEITVRQTDAAGNSGSDTRTFVRISLILDGRVLYANNCASCHGQIDVSTKRNRTAAQISTAFGTVPQMNFLSTLTPAQVSAVADSLRDAVQPGLRQTFACTTGQQSTTPMLKLTNREFRNSLNVLLDEFSPTLKSDAQLITLISQLPSDLVMSDRDTNKEQARLVTQDVVARYFEVALRAGALIGGQSTALQNYPGTSGCLAQAAVTQACLRLFVREFASRAFRRPLSSQEGNALADSLYDASLTTPDLVQLATTAVVQMPDFLYKAYDTGIVNPADNNLLNLTAHELASKISFFITGSPPDATLRSLATSGQILNSATLAQEVDRLFNLPAAQDMVQRLFRESYGYDVHDSFQYSALVLDGQSTTNLQSAMIQELDQFFATTVLTGNGTFQELLTSRQAQIGNAALAQLYGSATGSVILPANRAGFLNRASMLSKRSGNYSSSIKRGLKVLEHVLCEEVGPPPPDAPMNVGDPNPNQLRTTRERTAQSTEQPGSSCIACHARMNPLGYAFEGFDSLGRTRMVERIFNPDGSMILGSLPVNTQATSSELAPTPVTSASSQEMSATLGNSDKAMMCFVKHLKKFESRVAPVANDNCQMNSALSTLYGSNGSQGSVKAAIRSFILSDEFRRWKY